MKKISYLKIRTTPECLAQLKERAGKRGKTVSAFAHDELVRASQDAQQAAELAAIRQQMQELVVLVHTMRQLPPSADPEIRVGLRELRLIARELAMHSNTQILMRVSAQLKSQS